MMAAPKESTRAPYERWIPVARQVVRRTLRLGWDDVFEIYSYVPTIPLAEALALEARRSGSDTHVTLMTDDLWFTSMQELPTRWLRSASPAEHALNKTITAYIYLGGPADARRFRGIPSEKFSANAMGGMRQDEPLDRRKVRQVDLAIGRVTPERAEAYGLDFARWRKSYEAALAVDLEEIRKAGAAVARKLGGQRRVRIWSDAGTDLAVATRAVPPAVDDGIISPEDLRRGFVRTTLPAGSVAVAIDPVSAAGSVHFADPVFRYGRTVRGLRMTFGKGRLESWSAEENADIIARDMRELRGSRRRLGWMTIGLNRAAEPCMLDNSMVNEDVGFGMGVHPGLDRRSASGPQFDATSGTAHLEVDGRSLA